MTPPERDTRTRMHDWQPVPKTDPRYEAYGLLPNVTLFECACGSTHPIGSAHWPCNREVDGDR